MRYKFRQYLFSQRAIRAYWIANIVVFCALAGWIWSDGRFAEIASRFSANARSLIELNGLVGTREPLIAGRYWTLNILSVVAAVSAAGVGGGLFFGPPANRRVRSWLTVTVLAVLWLTLWVKWPDLQWRGQAFRVDEQLGEFQKMASSLNTSWPASDGERPELGPFLAYPTKAPTVLMLMTQANVPNTNLTFSLVERSETGALRFQLTCNELGAWLEWHPAHDSPTGFVGGLLERRELERFASLGNDWYLVRYK